MIFSLFFLFLDFSYQLAHSIDQILPTSSAQFSSLLMHVNLIGAAHQAYNKATNHQLLFWVASLSRTRKAAFATVIFIIIVIKQWWWGRGWKNWSCFLSGLRSARGWVEEAKVFIKTILLVLLRASPEEKRGGEKNAQIDCSSNYSASSGSLKWVLISRSDSNSILPSSPALSREESSFSCTRNGSNLAKREAK